LSPPSMLTSREVVASALLSWPSLGVAPSRGLKLYFAHTRTHPHPHSHPRTQPHMSQGSRSVFPQKRKILDDACTSANHNQRITKKGRPADISKISPGSVDKSRCVVVCCDTMRFSSCETLAMVNKGIVVQMEGFWRVCNASGSVVWHEWKWGWNAGGWGSKSYFEATCGATNAMEVC